MTTHDDKQRQLRAIERQRHRSLPAQRADELRRRVLAGERVVRPRGEVPANA